MIVNMGRPFPQAVDSIFTVNESLSIPFSFPRSHGLLSWDYCSNGVDLVTD